MGCTFAFDEAFNRQLDWDTSKVTMMQGTFRGAEAFNAPLDWDTSAVTKMRGMFDGANSFKDESVMNWNISAVPASGLNGMFLNSGILTEPCTAKFVYDAWREDLMARWGLSSQAAKDRLTLAGFPLQMTATECSPSPPPAPPPSPPPPSPPHHRFVALRFHGNTAES